MRSLRKSKIFNFLKLCCLVLKLLFKRKITANALFIVGAILLGQGLIAHSWQQRTVGSPPPKPWWWADTKAVAKLEVARLNKQVFVMQDDSGESLAFGPGHLSASAPISEHGHVMIAGHRDSHFKFLEQLNIGDVIETTSHQSKIIQYKIRDMAIVDSNSEELVRYDEDRLTLITCYPFDGFVPGGPLRYIVNAERIDT